MTEEKAMMVYQLLLYFGDTATQLEGNPEIQDELNACTDRQVVGLWAQGEEYTEIALRLKKAIEEQTLK